MKWDRSPQKGRRRRVPRVGTAAARVSVTAGALACQIAPASSSCVTYIHASAMTAVWSVREWEGGRPLLPSGYQCGHPVGSVALGWAVSPADVTRTLVTLGLAATLVAIVLRFGRTILGRLRVSLTTRTTRLHCHLLMLSVCSAAVPGGGRSYSPTDGESNDWSHLWSVWWPVLCVLPGVLALVLNPPHVWRPGYVAEHEGDFPDVPVVLRGDGMP